jgi:mercuric reductase
MLKRKNAYDYDLIVIGSGAGGSVGAHYARQLGKRVAIIEKEAIGGECPNVACVPTKALLHVAALYNNIKQAQTFGIETTKATLNYHVVRKWKDLVVSRTGTSHGEESFHSEGIDLIRGKAEFVSPHEVVAGGKAYSAARFIIATGSKVFIPPIPGIDEVGYITFKDAIDFEKPPGTILIFGGGAVGCEFAHIFNSFGSKVILVNRSGKILGKEDDEVSDLIQALFENDGVSVMTDTTIVKVEKKGKKRFVHMKRHNREVLAEVDEILIATGKVPSLDINLDRAGVVINDGRLAVNTYLQTNIKHIFAAGDVIGPYLFTHTGYYQSSIAAHNAFARQKIKTNYDAVPRCVFIYPEVASVGISEKEAVEKGIQIRKGIAPIAILGRANTSNRFDGFVKVITDRSDRLIGASIVAPHAGEMIHELTLAITLRVKASVIASMMHAYPTYSEAIKIACSNIV